VKVVRRLIKGVRVCFLRSEKLLVALRGERYNVRALIADGQAAADLAPRRRSLTISQTPETRK
jgi:hypothetical protein